MKAQHSDSLQGTFDADTPFEKLRMDKPLLACAKCICEHIPEARRGDRPMSDWAIKVMKTQSNLTWRMIGMDPTWGAEDPNANTTLVRSSCEWCKLQQDIKMKRMKQSGPSRNQK